MLGGSHCNHYMGMKRKMTNEYMIRWMKYKSSTVVFENRIAAVEFTQKNRKRQNAKYETITT